MHTKTTHKACNYIMAVYTLTRPFPLCLEVCSNHAQDLFHTHAHFIHCDYLYHLRKWQTEIIIMVSSFHSSLPTHTHTGENMGIRAQCSSLFWCSHSKTLKYFFTNFGPICIQLNTLLEIKEST